jgi:hypothetical protein
MTMKIELKTSHAYKIKSWHLLALWLIGTLLCGIFFGFGLSPEQHPAAITALCSFVLGVLFLTGDK